MRALVVGAGAIARQHLGALAHIATVDEVHVCDLSAVTARAMADRFQLAGWTTDLAEALRTHRPDVVHVTTPPASHFAIADQALDAGCHVIVEKPATLDPAQLVQLVAKAGELDLGLVEDYNYIYNPRVQEALVEIADGGFGDVVHVSVDISLAIFGKGSSYLDPAVNHSFSQMRGGAVADFLPHLASVAHAFVGAPSYVQTSWRTSVTPTGEPAADFRALLTAANSTASIGFSSRAQPDLFSVRIEGTRQRREINVFEGRAAGERQMSVARPLVPLLNGIRQGRDVGVGSLAALSGKLSGGPGAYAGLWTLVERCYEAFATGVTPPVTPTQMLEITAVVQALTEGSDAA